MAGSADRSLVMLRLPPGVPTTVADVAAHLAVASGDIDSGFGVVPIDPEGRRVVLRLASGRVVEVAARLGPAFAGPFSDPSVWPV